MPPRKPKPNLPNPCASMHDPSSSWASDLCEHCTRPRCGGTSRSGERCRRFPYKGARVCKMHGGGAPQTKAAADARVEAERLADEARKAVRTLGLPEDVDPTTALLEEVRRSAGVVRWFSDQVGALPADKVTVTSVMGASTHPLVKQYLVERQHHTRVCADAIRCGIEARQIALAERLAEQIHAAMVGFARDCGLDPADPKVVEAGARHLRLVGG